MKTNLNKEILGIRERAGTISVFFFSGLGEGAGTFKNTCIHVL